MICDFCGKPGTSQVFHGDGIAAVVLGADQSEFPPLDLSGDWHACDPCASFVRRRDMEGLIAHLLPVLMANKDPADTEFEEYTRNMLRQMYTGLFGQLDDKRHENN